jgi:hypothetical protein
VCVDVDADADADGKKLKRPSGCQMSHGVHASHSEITIIIRKYAIWGSSVGYAIR